MKGRMKGEGKKKEEGKKNEERKDNDPNATTIAFADLEPQGLHGTRLDTRSFVCHQFGRGEVFILPLPHQEVSGL